MSRLITKAQFARLIDKSKAHVTTLVKSTLAGAVVDGKIDRDHPDALAYIEESIPTLTINVAAPPSVDDFDALDINGSVPPTDFLAGTEIEGLGDFTLREIATKYGTASQLIDWLNARKKIVDISEKEIKNSKMRGELIPRAYVQQFIIDQFERTNMNLLNDAPKTIASEVMSIFKAGKTLEDAELSVERVISTHIQAGKDHVLRLIKGD